MDKKELVKSMDADIVIPLALFAALKEVEAPLCCPISFDSPTLRQYNGRFEIIEKARQALATLDAGEKEALARKIFNEPFKVSAESKVRIEALYTFFTELAGPLYQGNLMSEQIMTLEGITTKSYFQEAVQSASL